MNSDEHYLICVTTHLSAYKLHLDLNRQRRTPIFGVTLCYGSLQEGLQVRQFPTSIPFSSHHREDDVSRQHSKSIAPSMHSKKSKAPKIDVHHHVYPPIMHQGTATLQRATTYDSRWPRDTNDFSKFSRKRVETHQAGTYLPGPSKRIATFRQAWEIRQIFSPSPLQGHASKKTSPKQLN